VPAGRVFDDRDPIVIAHAEFFERRVPIVPKVA